MKNWIKPALHYVGAAVTTVIAVAPGVVTSIAPFFPESKLIQVAAAIAAALIGRSAYRYIRPDETLPSGKETGTEGWLMQPVAGSEEPQPKE